MKFFNVRAVSSNTDVRVVPSVVDVTQCPSALAILVVILT